MKNKLIIIAFILSIVGTCLVITIFKKKSTIYIPQKHQFLQKQSPNNHPLIPIIQEINKRNIKVNNFQSNIKIRASQKLTVRLNAKMAYEKNKKFRMTINSIVGKESDLGSNENHFWFYSKRYSSSLFYAKHTDLHKTLLRTPLHPIWIMESLGFNQLATDKIEIVKFKDKHWATIEKRKSTQNQEVSKVTLIDIQRKKIIGHYIYNNQEKMIASFEVKSTIKSGDHYLPKEVMIIWYEEGIFMELNFLNPAINTNIDPNNWQMPNMNKIDMGKS